MSDTDFAGTGVVGKVAHPNHHTILAISAPKDQIKEVGFLIFEISP
jgi:hypothetical protein